MNQQTAPQVQALTGFHCELSDEALENIGSPTQGQPQPLPPTYGYFLKRVC